MYKGAFSWLPGKRPGGHEKADSSSGGNKMYKIREAIQSDRNGIGKVYCDSWKTGYQNLLPKTYLDTLTVSNCTPDEVSANDIVLIEQERVLGICHISKARDRDGKEWAEVVAIYLLPEKWGSGAGSELFQAALRKLGQEGYKHTCLWVLKDNIRARKFYEKNGFAVSGNEREIKIAACSVSEVEYISIQN